MKQQLQPLWIGLAALAAILLLVVLYKVFLSEPPMPAPVTREEEMKHKGMNATNYAASNMKQYSGRQPGGPGEEKDPLLLEVQRL